MKSFLNKLKEIPKDITTVNYQRYRFFRITILLVLIGHILFLFTALWLEDSKIINWAYIAILIDILSGALLFKGKINTALFLIISHITFYNGFCIYEFGLDTSFSLYYLALIGFIFLTPWRLFYKILFSIFIVLTFTIFAMQIAYNGHSFLLDPNKTFFLNIINILMSGIVISFIVYTYANNAKMAETELLSMHTTKERLYSIIAHDLRGPIGSVAGLAKFLVDRLKEKNIDGKPLKFAKTIAKTAKDSNILLENLLAWTQNQQGEITPEIKVINVSNLVDNCVELHNAQIEQKQLVVNNECSSDIECMADEKMTFTVIRNLISNAIKFSNEGGELKISSIRDNGSYIFSIQDFGLGMPREVINDLFYPTTNKIRTGTHNEKGTGLGLILCKDLIEKNKGRIWIESTLNVGTKAMFSLPAKEN